MAKSTQGELDDSRILKEAETFLKAGNQVAVRLCTGLIDSLGCNLLTKSKARILLGQSPSMDPLGRKYHLQRAMTTIDAMKKWNQPPAGLARLGRGPVIGIRNPSWNSNFRTCLYFHIEFGQVGGTWL